MIQAIFSAIGVIGIIVGGLFITDVISLPNEVEQRPDYEEDFDVEDPNEEPNGSPGYLGDEVVSNPPTAQNPNTPTPMDNDVFVGMFKDAVELKFRTEVGQPIEGYEPAMFTRLYPGLQKSDFHNVDASIGRYVYVNGELTHDIEDAEFIHSAAGAITEKGYATLLNNILSRTTFPAGGLNINSLLQSISNPALRGPGPVACTMEAKMCPDGSAVGRTGPNCEFEACPSSEVTYCDEASKKAEFCTMEYAPVCGLVQVQCITTPCDPVPETFSNGCSACSRGNVISYTAGGCSI